MRFEHPEPVVQTPPVFPVFIPFAGCARRCVFCAQELQTGTSLRTVNEVLKDIESYFSQVKEGAVYDIGFYGGTFTALNKEDQKAYLSLASDLKEQGKVREVRCSTRPDNISEEALLKLQELGLDCIELGIQSFCAEPLEKSRRNYSGADAYKACKKIKLGGMSLGIQLLPGMPGMRPEHFNEDIKICMELKPDIVRLYPCLVLDGTVLADEWRSGMYHPWQLDTVLELLPPAILSLWLQGIRVIRIGLAPEPGMDKNILDGPHHPALGQYLRSRAIYLYLEDKILEARKHMPDMALYAPARVQGEFYGHKGELKGRYAELGLLPDRVHWWNDAFFELKPE